MIKNNKITLEKNKMFKKQYIDMSNKLIDIYITKLNLNGNFLSKNIDETTFCNTISQYKYSEETTKFILDNYNQIYMINIFKLIYKQFID